MNNKEREQESQNQQDRGTGSMDKQGQLHQQDEFLNNDLHRSEKEDSQGLDKDQKLEKKWVKIKEDFLQKYSNITNGDVAYNKGEFGNMLGRLEHKTGKSHTELRNEINRWNINQQRD